MEHKIQKQHIERIDMLYRYLYDSKKFIIRELERILVDTIGFNNELEFSEEIEGFDKIRVSDILCIQIHYNKEEYDGKKMWVEFTQLSNITLITDILNDIYATYINKLDLDTNITSFQAISKKCCTFAQDFKK